MKQRIYSSFILLLAAFGMARAAGDSFDNPLLNFCVSSYRDGYYQKTIDCVNEVMPALTTASDSVAAFKFLGLSYGMLNQIESSKQNFKQAMDKDPWFEIDTLEFPPNITGIYNQMKLEHRAALLDSLSHERKTVAVQGKPGILAPTVYLSATAMAGGAAGFFFYRSHILYDDYRAEKRLDRRDSYYSGHLNALIAGICCSGVVPVTFYLFLRKTVYAKRAALIGERGRFFLALSF